MSRRSKRLWAVASSAPIAFSTLVVLDRIRIARDKASGWDPLEYWPPWYIKLIGIVFFVGIMFAVAAICSTVVDFLRRRREIIV
jgi:hypothetical protein